MYLLWKERQRWWRGKAAQGPKLGVFCEKWPILTRAFVRGKYFNKPITRKQSGTPRIYCIEENTSIRLMSGLKDSGTEMMAACLFYSTRRFLRKWVVVLMPRCVVLCHWRKAGRIDRFFGIIYDRLVEFRNDGSREFWSWVGRLDFWLQEIDVGQCYGTYSNDPWVVGGRQRWFSRLFQYWSLQYSLAINLFNLDGIVDETHCWW